MKKLLMLLAVSFFLVLIKIEAQTVKELKKQYSEQIKQYKKANKCKIALYVERPGFWYYVTTTKSKDGNVYAILDKDFNKTVEVDEAFINNYTKYETLINRLFPKLKEYGEKEHIEKYEAWQSNTGKCFFFVNKTINGQEVSGILDFDLNVIAKCEYIHFAWISAIHKGAHNYDTKSYTGGRDLFCIFDYEMPEHFEALRLDKSRIDVLLLNGEHVGYLPNLPSRHYGSWVFTNQVDENRFYVGLFDGKKELVIESEKYNLGMYKWDGTKLFDEIHDFFRIRDHNKNTRSSYLFSHSNNGVGGVILDDLSTLVPSVFSQARTEITKNRFLVKYDATDPFHVYVPGELDSMKNEDIGRKLYLEKKYKECIEYYSKADVSDSDSKLLVAGSMYSMAFYQIKRMEAYISYPDRVPKPKGFNYDENKELLESAIRINNVIKAQDPSKSVLCDENFKMYNEGLQQLEKIKSTIEYNSFGNRLLRALAEGVVEGICKAAESPNSKSKSNTVKSSNNGNSSNAKVTTSSNKQNNTGSNNETPQWARNRYNQLKNEIERCKDRIPNMGKLKGQEEERLQRYMTELNELKMQYGFD